MRSCDRRDSGERKSQLIEGEKDPLGDSSLIILSTPGHTPRHRSLLVSLEKTGYVVLSGGVVHLQSNWDNRAVSDFNYDKVQSSALGKAAWALDKKHAQLWINHDKLSSDARCHTPEI